MEGGFSSFNRGGHKESTRLCHESREIRAEDREKKREGEERDNSKVRGEDTAYREPQVNAKTTWEERKVWHRLNEYAK